MNEPLISVIIPVYNAEKYVSECLESLLSQSYSHFELILVDDGSVDHSWEVCQSFATADARVKLLRQPNKGASAARNAGIEQATGAYLCFVDSDDWVKPDYLSALFADALPQYGDGLVIHGLQEINPSREVTRVVRFRERTLVGAEIGLAFSEMSIYLNGYSASKLYCLSLINRYHVRFNEAVVHAEDLLFMIDYLMQADYLHLGAKSNYIYENRGSSLSRSNRPFHSEKGCYEQLKTNIQLLIGRFQLPFDALAGMEEMITLFLSRALNALYRPPYTLPRKERLNQLRALTDYDIAILSRYQHSYRILEKIGKQLLVRRYWWMYETYMCFIFWLRYRLLAK